MKHFYPRLKSNDLYSSGLAWHTDDNALRIKFEEFGQVEEAVCRILPALPTFSLMPQSRSWSRTAIPDVAVVLAL